MRFRRKAAEGSGTDAVPVDSPVDGADRPDASADAAPTDTDDAGSPPASPRGPWDVTDLDDDVTRIDFGAVLVPAVDGMEVRLDMDEQGGVAAVAVAVDGSVLQVQAFAAPRSSGLWDEIRAEMVDGIKSSGGTVTEADGPFGPELRAMLPAQAPDGSTTGKEPVRFLGVDGPRWFLRGVVTGAGAADVARADGVHTFFRGVAVVRGDVAAPPREMLELKVPDDPSLQPGPTSGG
jgi:hypothetical protein